MPTTDNVARVFESGRILQVGDRNGRPAGPEMTLTVAGVRPFKGGLLVLGVEHAKKEGRDDAVETIVGKIHLHHIHFAQIDRRAELILAPPGAVEHGRAEVEVRR